jgi:serralysin
MMNGTKVISSGPLGSLALKYSLVGTGDYNGDGMADLLWRDDAGNTSIWFMNGIEVTSGSGISGAPAKDTHWSVVGTGDFNGDGTSDIVWRDDTGNTEIWLMNGANVLAVAALGNQGTAWSIAQVGDYNGDGRSDLIWRKNDGDTTMWFMNSGTVIGTSSLGNIGTNWTIQSTDAE